MRSFLNLKLPDAPGLVKHVSVSPAPSVPGPGDSNLLSYVYRLGSSAAAHPDYITLMRGQEQCNGVEVSCVWLLLILLMYVTNYKIAL